jgi:hypothetical protein
LNESNAQFLVDKKAFYAQFIHRISTDPLPSTATPSFADRDNPSLHSIRAVTPKDLWPSWTRREGER